MTMRSQIIPTPAEIEHQRFNRATLDQACSQFHEHGALVLRGAYSESHLSVAKQAISRRVADGVDVGQSRSVGNRRMMTSLPIEYPFNAPHIYANPLVMRMLARLLANSFVLNSFGAVIAEPGAEAQHVHLDHPSLFDRDDLLSSDLPVYAVTVLIPLVAMSQEHGTTQVWEGSHRLPEDQALSNGASHVTTTLGDSLLMDYRVWHGGTEVRQERERPVLYFVYSRPWFRDFVNFPANYQLQIGREDFEKVPLDLQHLFALAAWKPDCKYEASRTY